MVSTVATTPEVGSVTARPLRWLLSSGLRGYLVIGALLLQFALPFAAFLVGEPPTRFGFQMYSGLGGASVEAFGANGRSIDLDLTDLIAGSLRPEMDWTQRLPEHVCDSVSDVASVTVEQSSKQRTVTCP